MWQKYGGLFCHGIEGEEEKEEDDRDINPDYKDDYDHGDDWDLEELLVYSEEKEKESNNNNEEEDDDGYTASERVYMNVTLEDDDSVGYTASERAYMNVTLEDDDSVESVVVVEEEEEKDERYYLREIKALEKVAVINNLRLQINEAGFWCQEARKTIGQAK